MTRLRKFGEVKWSRSHFIGLSILYNPMFKISIRNVHDYCLMSILIRRGRRTSMVLVLRLLLMRAHARKMILFYWKFSSVKSEFSTERQVRDKIWHENPSFYCNSVLHLKWSTYSCNCLCSEIKQSYIIKFSLSLCVWVCEYVCPE